MAKDMDNESIRSTSLSDMIQNDGIKPNTFLALGLPAA